MSLLLLAAVIAQPAVAENVWAVKVDGIECARFGGAPRYYLWDVEWNTVLTKRWCCGEAWFQHETRWCLVRRGCWEGDAAWLYRGEGRWLLWVPSQGLLFESATAFAADGDHSQVADFRRSVLE